MIVDVLADYGIPQRLAQITIIGFVAAGIIGYFWRIIVIGIILVSIISIFATGSTKPKENSKIESPTVKTPDYLTIVPKQNTDKESEETEDNDTDSNAEAEKQREEKELQEFIKTLPVKQTTPVKIVSEEEQFIRDCKNVANYSYNECKKMWILKRD
jgi:hypothetical protein